MLDEFIYFIFFLLILNCIVFCRILQFCVLIGVRLIKHVCAVPLRLRQRCVQLSHGGKAKQSVSLWQLSVTSGGCRCKKTLTFPCASAARAEPELLSNLWEETQTYTEGQRKRENLSFHLVLAEGPIHCGYLLLSIESNFLNILTRHRNS